MTFKLCPGVLWGALIFLSSCGEPTLVHPEAGAVDEGRFAIADGVFDATGFSQFKLPRSLREISGLALTADGILLGHNDEQAIVYELDVAQQTVARRLQLGDPPALGDFEGIATTAQRLFLVTSSGSIYAAELPGSTTERSGIVAYEVHEAQLPCEVEGLVYDSGQDSLLAACKHISTGDDVIAVYAWNLRDQEYDNQPLISLQESDFAGITKKLKKLRPSGITITRKGNLLLVTRHGGKPALLEISRTGTVIELQELPDRQAHQQTEGIVLTDTNQLILADEGGHKKTRKGRLSVYQPR